MWLSLMVDAEDERERRDLSSAQRAPLIFFSTNVGVKCPFTVSSLSYACSREKAKDKTLDVMSFLLLGIQNRGIVFGTGQIHPSQKAIPLTLFLCMGHMQTSGTLWICVTFFNQVCKSWLTSPPSLQYQPNYIGFAMYVFCLFFYIYLL